MIPISYPRLYRAVFEINKRYGLTTRNGHYANRLKARHAREITERMNHLREEFDIDWYRALVFAAAAQKGIGPSRKALYRKAIGLYGWWMRESMRKRSIAYHRLPRGTKPFGLEITMDISESGQYQFFSAHGPAML